MEPKINTISVLQWFILLFTLATLLLTYGIYNQTGTDLGQEIKQETAEVSENTQIAAAKAEAYARLVAIHAEVATDQTYAEATDEVQEIRQDLQVAYQDASAETREELNELDRNLAAAEAELRDASTNALNTLEVIIVWLKQDIRN